MILTNRRHRLLYISMAGMIVASSLPLVYLLLALLPNLQSSSLITLLAKNQYQAFIVLWLIMLVYMLSADLINSPRVTSPLREVLIVALLPLTSLIAVRLLIFPTAPLVSGQWIYQIFQSLLNFTQGIRIEVAVLLLNSYLWIRTALLTDNDLTFLHVGMSFRVALLLSLLGNTMLTLYVDSSTGMAVRFFLIYLGFGLIAVALARIDQMAVGVADSRGAVLPWSRLVHIVAATLLLLLGILSSSRVLTPNMLRSLLQLFSPLWTALRWVFVQAIYLIFLALTPLLERLAQLVASVMGDMEPQPMTEQTMPPNEYVSISDMVREVALIRYCLVAVVVAVVVGLLLIYFVRTARRTLDEWAEEIQDENITYGGGLARRGLDRLRTWLQLLRNFGMGRQLLDAITVENMYANLLRIAHVRGYPRPAATPPDKFLPTLQRVFPHNEQPLLEITSAYMRVYYGERAIGTQELVDLQLTYRSIVESIEEDSELQEPDTGA